MFELPRRTLLTSLLAVSAASSNRQYAAAADLQPSADGHAGTVKQYDIREYGAIWDGRSHPLSQRYATLEEARTVYSFVTSLDEELDWAATQAAINDVVANWHAAGQRFGAIVMLPPGTGRLNRALFYPANPVWISENYPVVHLTGHGRGSTILEWRDNSALIDGGYAIQPRNAVVADGRIEWEGDHALLHSDCRLSGFALRGPGAWHDFPAPTSRVEFVARYGFDTPDWSTAFNRDNARIGQLFENYGGLSAGEATILNDLTIEGFSVGINWRGGQKLASYVYVLNCYYALYVTFTPEAHGDFLIQKSNFSGRFAAVALAPGAGFFGHLDTCFIGSSPYGFYKEGTDANLTAEQAIELHGAHWNSFLSGMLSYCQFESIGNSVICEGNIGRRHQISDLTLQNCAYIDWHDFSFPRSDVGYRGAILNDALIDVGRWSRISILRNLDPEWWRPRDIALFMYGEAEDITIDGFDGLLRQGAKFGKPVFFCSGNGVKPAGSIRISGDGWSGSIQYLDTGYEAEILSGDLVGRYPDGCRPFSEDALELLGVAMENGYRIAGVACLAVATTAAGPLDLNIDPQGPMTGNWWRPSPDTAGKVVLSGERTSFGSQLEADGGKRQFYFAAFRF